MKMDLRSGNVNSFEWKWMDSMSISWQAVVNAKKFACDIKNKTKLARGSNAKQVE